MKRHHKYVYAFGPRGAAGDASMKNLLGSKGVNLAEMCRIGLPVPAGFTITTECCVKYLRLGGKYPNFAKVEVEAALKETEAAMGMKYGDPENPLLVSCRSSARRSMPGMMDTVLNVGLCTKTIPGLIRRTGNPRFVYDSYRRLIMMYSGVVMEDAEGVAPRDGKGIRKHLEQTLDGYKRANGKKSEIELSAEDLEHLAGEFKAQVREVLCAEFPDDPYAQLWGAISAAFKSWCGKRATAYRRVESVPDDWGTAVNVQSMVFGNMGDTSATGVAFTRDPATGEKKFYGEWLANAQGEDVVAGIRTPESVDRLAHVDREAYRRLVAAVRKLEHYHRDMLDIEFTIQQGKVYILQARVGKRTGTAAARMAVEMVKEGLIDCEAALLRIIPSQLEDILRPHLDPSVAGISKVLARGLPAGPGAAYGEITFTAVETVTRGRAGKKVILLLNDMTMDDVEGIRAAAGIITARGGMSSQIATVARMWGKCCIVGCEALTVDENARTATLAGKTLSEGTQLSMDGTRGYIYEGSIPFADDYLKPNSDFAQIMSWADQVRGLGVRASADTPEDAKVARKMGAEGIGLYRIEHIFYGIGSERPLFLLQKMILSACQSGRIKALKDLYPFVKRDIKAMLGIMSGLPVAIRLLDPPLHEFMPQSRDKQAELAQALGITAEDVQKRCDALHESNPMMGHRGVRLGVTCPEVTEMQLRAIFEGAVELVQAGKKCKPEIMIPATCDVRELTHQKVLCRKVHAEVCQRMGVKKIDYLYGTMIETPRAALLADQMAKEAQFFSFGTNDLTQVSFGFSRDDAQSFLPEYLEQKLLAADPFRTIDQDGVGQLIQMAIKSGRRARPDLKLGICGEQSGDPASVEFCSRQGFDYVSCAPYRVPVARLVAAQAALLSRPAERVIAAAGTHRLGQRADAITGSYRRKRDVHSLAADVVWDLAFSSRDDLLACASSDGEVRLMNGSTGEVVRRLRTGCPVNAVSFSPTTGHLAAGTGDGEILVFDLPHTRPHHVARVCEAIEKVTWTSDGQRIAYCTGRPRLEIRPRDGMQPTLELRGNRGAVRDLAVLDRRRIAACSEDCTVRLWDVFSGECLATLLGHTQAVNALATCYPQGHVISGSDDSTIRVWDPDLPTCICVLEGHRAPVWDIATSADGLFAASVAMDNSVRVWDLHAEACLHVVDASTPIYGILIVGSKPRLLVVGQSGITTHDISRLAQERRTCRTGIRYSSAKVVLCGESGVGKTCLSDRLIRNRYIRRPTTHGLRVLPMPQLRKSSRSLERDVWLWDLAGQPEYRLIHQLFLDQTSLALVIFDPFEPTTLEKLTDWEKRLRLAVRSDPARILVSAQMDKQGKRVSPGAIENYRSMHGYVSLVATSAATGRGRRDLLRAIARNIPWNRIAPVTTDRTFKLLKDTILRLRDQIPPVVEFAALAAIVRRAGENPRHTDEDLRHVLRLLSNENVVRQLDYGNLVLLKPELLNAYASSLIQAAGEFTDKLSGLDFEDAMQGNCDLKRIRRIPREKERTLIPAVIQLLQSRGLCIRIPLACDRERLVFPSECRRRWEKKLTHSVLVRYEFCGQVSNLWVTLAVRLIYSGLCKEWWLFENAITVTMPGGDTVDVVVIDTAAGNGDVQILTEQGHRDDVAMGKLCGFVQQHVQQLGISLVRTRYFRCGMCGKLFGDQTAAEVVVKAGASTTKCRACGESVNLLDAVERTCRGEELDRLVGDARERASIRIDSEAKEAIMVGEMQTVVAKAGQRLQLFGEKHPGVDGHIYFLDKAGKPTGMFVHLQLKHGDSYIRHRDRDDKDVFDVRKPDDARAWRESVVPVFLVLRSTNGDLKWMNVTEYLRSHAKDEGKRIVFDGSPVTDLAIIRLRDTYLKALGGTQV